MGSLRESVLNCRINACSDDDFIANLNKLVGKNGEDIYPAIIQLLTHLELEPGEAKKCWKEIITHRQDLSAALNREMDLITSISDYFFSLKKPLKHHKVIEINTFEKLVKESTHDVLAGLFNKAYLRNALDQHLSLSKRNNTDLSILFLDIDNFKDINDTFGHHSGDIVLKNVADIINREMRESDIKARFGGDEFVILMPNTYKTNALLLAERLRKAIKQKPCAVKDTSIQITVSGGVAGFPADAQKSETLLSMADSALYRAKGAGKNCISLFKEDKRRFVRIKFNRAIKVKKLGFNRTRTLSGTSKDIAIGGILFENKEPISVGTRVQLSIPISRVSDPVLLIGTIVRVRTIRKDRYDIGMILSFKEMEKTAKDEISKFLVIELNEKTNGL